MHRILIVDDNETNLALERRLVERIDDCEAVALSDPRAALALTGERVFDLVLVDYMMPDIDGIAFIRSLRQTRGHEHVPVVMVTTNDERAVCLDALVAGATDFLIKPVDPIEFRVRLRNLLELRAAQNALAARAVALDREVAEKTRAVVAREREIVWRLSRATERRDTDTGDHIARMSRICRLIAEELFLPEEDCRLIELASQMHDVGKVGIPDEILFKPGPLTPEERAVMETHTKLGWDILAGSPSRLLQMAAEIAVSHHEKWDGSGYPERLAGEAIPLVGRITAVADVFDALMSDRPYKRAWPLEKARALIEEGRGRHFDPICVDAFFRRWTEVAAIAGQPRDAVAA